jgi:PIN domain nuclease of toxin-antitoxin system
MKAQEQKLVDIMFEVALTISDKKLKLYKKTNEEKAEWVADQLRKCGFNTMPCGSSWGVLLDN